MTVSNTAETPLRPGVDKARSMKSYALVGVVASGVLIPFCLRLLARDHFVVPLVLFPLPMGMVLNFNVGEEATFCTLAAFQFPLYGLVLGYARAIDGLQSFAVALLIAHAIAIVIAFMSFL